MHAYKIDAPSFPPVKHCATYSVWNAMLVVLLLPHKTTFPMKMVSNSKWVHPLWFPFTTFPREIVQASNTGFVFLAYWFCQMWQVVLFEEYTWQYMNWFCSSICMTRLCSWEVILFAAPKTHGEHFASRGDGVKSVRTSRGESPCKDWCDILFQPKECRVIIYSNVELVMTP